MATHRQTLPSGAKLVKILQTGDNLTSQSVRIIAPMSIHSMTAPPMMQNHVFCLLLCSLGFLHLQYIFGREPFLK